MKTVLEIRMIPNMKTTSKLKMAPNEENLKNYDDLEKKKTGHVSRVIGL